jgi:hypothetical protein
MVFGDAPMGRRIREFPRNGGRTATWPSNRRRAYRRVRLDAPSASIEEAGNAWLASSAAPARADLAPLRRHAHGGNPPKATGLSLFAVAQRDRIATKGTEGRYREICGNAASERLNPGSGLTKLASWRSTLGLVFRA